MENLTYDQKASIATANLKRKFKGVRVIKEYCGFMILAQSDRDFESKKRSLTVGDTFGFYTVEQALKIK